MFRAKNFACVKNIFALESLHSLDNGEDKMRTFVVITINIICDSEDERSIKTQRKQANAKVIGENRSNEDATRQYRESKQTYRMREQMEMHSIQFMDSELFANMSVFALLSNDLRGFFFRAQNLPFFISLSIMFFLLFLRIVLVRSLQSSACIVFDVCVSRLLLSLCANVDLLLVSSLLFPSNVYRQTRRSHVPREERKSTNGIEHPLE